MASSGIHTPSVLHITMKAFVVLAVVVGCSLGAPTEELTHNKLQRTKKSPEPSGGYGAGYGVAPFVATAPCAGAAPISPIALYLSPQSAVGPHYREDEHKEETGEHARSYYDSPVAASVAAASAAAAVSAIGAPAGLALAAAPGSGPAVGLFPNAKVGGCAIPLLLSCAPNVVSGHLAQHSAYPAAYRAHEAEHEHHQMREMAPASASAQGWAESARTANQMTMQPESQQLAMPKHTL